MKTYVFEVEIEQEEDGRWSAVIPALPGCNAWGYTREESLEAIQDNGKMYLEALAEFGDPMPWELEDKSKAPEGEFLTITVSAVPEGYCTSYGTLRSGS